MQAFGLHFSKTLQGIRIVSLAVPPNDPKYCEDNHKPLMKQFTCAKLFAHCYTNISPTLAFQDVKKSPGAGFRICTSFSGYPSFPEESTLILSCSGSADKIPCRTCSSTGPIKYGFSFCCRSEINDPWNFRHASVNLVSIIVCRASHPVSIQPPGVNSALIWRKCQNFNHVTNCNHNLRNVPSIPLTKQ